MEDKLESLQLKLSKKIELCVTMAEEKDTLREALKDSEQETANYRNIAERLSKKMNIKSMTLSMSTTNSHIRKHTHTPHS